MKFNSWLECERGCGSRYSIYDIIYQCKECGGLLDVHHDLDALRKKSSKEWKNIFESRRATNQWPYGSGVWGKKEWVSPQIDDESVASFFEGWTNCFWAKRLGQEIELHDLWLKLSGNSHTGSFKDLGMTVLVSFVQQMIADGKKIKAIACASTGDTSAALSAYAAYAGIRAVILLPKNKVSNAQLIQPISNGAQVFSLNTDFDGCMKIVQELSKDPEIYLANSMNSLRMEGQKTVGIEIVQQFDWQVPDWIVLPAGNLGNVSALGKGLSMMKELGLIDKLPRIVCAQAEMANPFYLSYKNNFKSKQTMKAQNTLASAIQIGDPVSYERAVKVMKTFDGIVEQVSEEELKDASARADQTGLYTCPQTAVALGVLFRLRENNTIQRSDRVVVISTAHGLKFSKFKNDYHSESKDIFHRYANTPIEIEPDIELIKNSINSMT